MAKALEAVMVIDPGAFVIVTPGPAVKVDTLILGAAVEPIKSWPSATTVGAGMA